MLVVCWDIHVLGSPLMHVVVTRMHDLSSEGGGAVLSHSGQRKSDTYANKKFRSHERQNFHLKMQQNLFGGRSPSGTTEGAYSVPQTY